MLRLWFVALACGCLAAGACAPVRHEGRFRTDPRAPYVRADLSDIVATPHEYRETDVVFSAVFDSSSEVIYIPGYTPFAEEKHVAFSVWIEGTRFWNAADSIKGLVRTLYMRKDNPNLGKLVRIPQFQPVEIKGMVRSSFNDIPWIEAFEVAPMGSLVCNREGLRAMLMGMDAASSGDVEAANAHFRQAAYHIDSPHAKVDTNLSLARALARRRTLPDMERAISHYRSALSYSGGNPAIQIELDGAVRIADMLRRGEPVERPPEAPDQPAVPSPGGDSSSLDLVRQLQGMIKKKDEEIADLKRLMSHAAGATSQAIAKSEAERESLSRQVAELRTQAAEIVSQLEEVRTQKANLETEIERFRAELSRTTEERDEVREQLKAASEARIKGQERESMLEQQLAEAAERIASLEKSLAEDSDAQKARVVELERQKAALEAEVLRLRNSAAGGEAARRKVIELEAKIESLEAAKARAGAESDEALRARIAELDAKVQALEASRAELTAELQRAKVAGGVDEKALRKEIAKEYEEEILDYQKLVTRQRETIKQLEARIKELEKK